MKIYYYLISYYLENFGKKSQLYSTTVLYLFYIFLHTIVGVISKSFKVSKSNKKCYRYTRSLFHKKGVN